MIDRDNHTGPGSANESGGKMLIMLGKDILLAFCAKSYNNPDFRNKIVLHSLER